MLTIISPSKVLLERGQYLPHLFRPIVTAIETGQDIAISMTNIVQRLGFENFMYGASLSPRLDHESRTYVFTTLSPAWVHRYDERAYIEVDTRIAKALHSALPLFWEYTSERGHSKETDAFLDDSLAHGVGSGVICGIHGPRQTKVIFALSLGAPRIDEILRKEIEERLGDILLLGAYFHEVFMRAIVEQQIPPSSLGLPLSMRERQCLELAARGQTTQDIAVKLEISERTVQFHFDGIRAKLGAANRQEAVAKGMALGMIGTHAWLGPFETRAKSAR